MSMTRKPRHRAETAPGNAAQTIGRGSGSHQRDAERPSDKGTPASEQSGERAGDDTES
jgi:hypothetical protein